MITNEQWNKVEEKYKKLMYAISYRIGGDKITNDIDDSIQELSMAAMDAISTYARKTDETFDSFFTTKAFDKYIKTCLWNRKNSNGTRIKKRGKLNNPLSIHDFEEVWFQDGGDSIVKSKTNGVVDKVQNATSGVDASELFFEADLNVDSRRAVEKLLEDGKTIKPNGRININKLSRELGKTKNEVRYVLKRLKQELDGYDC